MKREEWRKFFQDLPESEHELVIVGLTNGAEVAVQRIMKYFDSFMVVRGRLGGTDDAGHIFCLPYDNMEMVFFSRIQGDETVVAMFGDIIGGIKREFLTDPAEDEKKKQQAEEEAAAQAEALAGLPGGALPAGPRQAPANVSALRSKLLANRSKRIDPRTRG